MTAPDAPHRDDDARSRRARRTALGLGLFAAAVFVAFIAFTGLTR